MDYRKTAEEILKGIGGRENLISAAHCATRLRLVVAAAEKADKKAIENAEGVKGVFVAQGQLQIIIGTGTVNKVYDEFVAVSGIETASKAQVKEAAAAQEKPNAFKRLIKTLGDVFVPIIPAIVAGGFLMGIIEALNFMAGHGFISLDVNGSTYVILKLLSNAAYTFLPILIAFSAAKTFGANPFLGAVLAMFLIHPELQNAWSVATEGVARELPVWFGLYSVPFVGYQGHVIPIVIACWMLAFVEKRLHKIIPDMVDLFVTPLVSLLVSGYLTFTIVGPVFSFVETSVLTGIQWIIALPFGVGGMLAGLVYSVTVVAGVHHMYTVIDLGQISAYGFTYWLPIASAANVAQGGAALAVALRTKNKKMKSMAIPAALSACMGITEPAIFGVNLRYMRPFIGAALGGAAGGLYASLVHLGATGTGVTGIFGILLHLHSPLNYIITMLIAFGVAFGVTLVLGWKEEEA